MTWLSLASGHVVLTLGHDIPTNERRSWPSGVHILTLSILLPPSGISWLSVVFHLALELACVHACVCVLASGQIIYIWEPAWSLFHMGSK